MPLSTFVRYIHPLLWECTFAKWLSSKIRNPDEFNYINMWWAFSIQNRITFFFSKMMMVLILMSSTFIIMQTTLPCLSSVVICTTPHSVPTPTVCGHAEACPSTTYAKWAIPALWSAVAARWAGVIPQQKFRPAGRVLPAVQNQNPPSRKRHVKRAIFLFNHTNFTIFCMRPWNGHTRRSSCWRFAM